MREYISYKDIANTVMMMKSAVKGTIAVVEGVTDRRLYGKFFDKENSEIVIAHCKDNVRNSVKEVYQNRRMHSVIGIMDADLDILMNRRTDAPLFLTDTRDSENMMFNSDAFYDVLEELADAQKVKRLESKYGDLRTRIMDAAYPIGILMYISYRNRFNLSFKDLVFEDFISTRDLSCDIERLAEGILNKSERTDIKPETLADMVRSEPVRPRENVCRGHDIISVMAIGLRSVFGGPNCRNISDSHLAGNFRLAFSERYMKETKLYSDTFDWCSEKGMILWKVRD